jgi:hypothetical protein
MKAEKLTFHRGADYAASCGPHENMETRLQRFAAANRDSRILREAVRRGACIAGGVLLAPREIVPAADGPRYKSQDDEGVAFASADQKIAEYLENRKISPAIRAQSTPEPIGFGKRRT